MLHSRGRLCHVRLHAGGGCATFGDGPSSGSAGLAVSFGFASFGFASLTGCLDVRWAGDCWLSAFGLFAVWDLSSSARVVGLSAGCLGAASAGRCSLGAFALLAVVDLGWSSGFASPASCLGVASAGGCYWRLSPCWRLSTWAGPAALPRWPVAWASLPPAAVYWGLSAYVGGCRLGLLHRLCLVGQLLGGRFYRPRRRLEFRFLGDRADRVRRRAADGQLQPIDQPVLLLELAAGLRPTRIDVGPSLPPLLKDVRLLVKVVEDEHTDNAAPTDR